MVLTIYPENPEILKILLTIYPENPIPGFSG